VATTFRQSRGAPFVSGLALGLLLTLACHAQFRFDDRPIDANEVADTRSADQAPTVDGGCGAPTCGYEREQCGGASCKLECPHDETCAGECGAGCTTDCEERSRCALTTGAGAQVRCEADADCELVLGPGSQALCDPGASCTVRCLGSCGASCRAGASCALACGASTAPQRFTASGSCT
jgi:hypothetical protein